MEASKEGCADLLTFKILSNAAEGAFHLHLENRRVMDEPVSRGQRNQGCRSYAYVVDLMKQSCTMLTLIEN